MIGVVLSGGQSSRMGQDKGLMKKQNKVWARVALDLLRELSIDAVVSINQNQLKEYLKSFEESELVIDQAELEIHGPLKGILTTHLHFPKSDLIVLACDMCEMKSIVLEKLLDKYRQEQAQAIAFGGQTIEPLCAVYSAHGLSKIKSLYLDGSLSKHSMMNVLEILNSVYIPIEKEWQYYFKNFNWSDNFTS